jgi:pantetheine-phosphate adenylyltransferase
MYAWHTLSVFKHRSITVGGTFWPLHRGHKTLLQEAFADGLEVFVGLTSDRMISSKNRSGAIPNYGVRKRNLLAYLDEMDYSDRSHIFRIEDEYGFAADFPNLQAIAVTERTRTNAEKINQRRIARGMTPLDIIQVKLVKAEDGVPISSSRVRAGIIDSEGHLPDRS